MNSNSLFYSNLALAISIVTFIIYIVVYYKYGRYDEEMIETVEIKPRKWMTPLALSAVIDGYITWNDMVATIMDLANRGYLEIIEREDGSYLLKKLKDSSNEDCKVIRELMEFFFFCNTTDTFLLELELSNQVQRS